MEDANKTNLPQAKEFEFDFNSIIDNPAYDNYWER